MYTSSSSHSYTFAKSHHSADAKWKKVKKQKMKHHLARANVKHTEALRKR